MNKRLRFGSIGEEKYIFIFFGLTNPLKLLKQNLLLQSFK